MSTPQQLADDHCVPCSKKAIRELGLEKMSSGDVQTTLATLAPGWALKAQPVAGEPESLPEALSKVYRFKNFATASQFASAVGKEADAEGHHPAILLEWGSVAVWWWSHALGGVRGPTNAVAQERLCHGRTDRQACRVCRGPQGVGHREKNYTSTVRREWATAIHRIVQASIARRTSSPSAAMWRHPQP